MSLSTSADLSKQHGQTDTSLLFSPFLSVFGLHSPCGQVCLLQSQQLLLGPPSTGPFPVSLGQVNSLLCTVLGRCGTASPQLCPLTFIILCLGDRLPRLGPHCVQAHPPWRATEWSPGSAPAGGKSMCRETGAAPEASLLICSPGSTCPPQGCTWSRKGDVQGQGAEAEAERECRDQVVSIQVGQGRTRIQGTLWDLKGGGRLGLQLLPSGGQKNLWSSVPACGHILCQGLALRPLREVTQGARQAKVTEFHPASSIQQNVGWLDRGMGFLRPSGPGAQWSQGTCGHRVDPTFWSRWMTRPEWINLVALRSW